MNQRVAPLEPAITERRPSVATRMWSFSREYGSVVGGMGAARLLTFFASALLARELSVGGFGAYAVVYTLVVLLSQLSAVLDASFVRHYSVAESERDRHSYLRAHFQIRLAFVAFLTIGGVAAAPWLSTLLLHSSNQIALVAAGIVAGVFLSAVGSGLAYLQAMKRFGSYGILSFGLNAFGFLALLIYIRATEATPLGSMLVFNTSVYILGGTAVLFWLRRRSAKHEDGGAARAELVRFTGWLVPATILYTLLQRADLLLLARLSDQTEVGLYAAVVSLAAIASLFTSNLSVVFLPKAAAALRDRAKMQRYIWESALVMGFLTLLIFLAGLLAGPLLRLTFGERFENASDALRILLATYLLIAAQPPLTALLYARDRTRPIFIQRSVELVLAISVAVLLIPRWGSEGAASSMAFAYLAGTTVLFVSVLFEKRTAAKENT